MKEKKFEIQDGKIIFEKLSKFYNKKEIDNWGKKACLDINEIFEKYHIYDFKLNKNSYMGIVMDCKSKTNNELFIKIVPPMLERFEKEVGILKLLPKNLTCQLYEIDYEKKAIIMEKLIPGDLVDFYNNKDLYLKLFNDLYANKIEINNIIDKEYNDFSEIVEKDYLISKKIKHNFSKQVDELYSQFLISYEKINYNAKKYLLHGDIYMNNAIMSNNIIKLIDPLGFKAPYTMELVSICAYEIFNNKGDKTNIEILNDFIKFFASFVDKNTYKEAMFCELVKVFIPSIYEANDSGVRASKWLAILRDLYPSKFHKEA